MALPKLSPRQEEYCHQYVIDLSSSKAAIRAGYSKQSAHSKASQLMDLPQIKHRISELQAEIRKRNELSADMVIEELRALAFYNIQDLVNQKQGVINIKKGDRKLLKPIVGFRVTESFTKSGERTITTDVKLADKRAALTDLGKHLGIFEKDNKQKVLKISVVRK